MTDELRGRTEVATMIDTAAFADVEDMDLQAGGPGLTPLEAIEHYPEGAAIAARELGVTVDELKTAFKVQEKAKKRLPIIGDPNQPKSVEPKLLQIQEPREPFDLNTPIGEGSTTLDMWRFRAEKAEATAEQYRLEIEKLHTEWAASRDDVRILLAILGDRERAAKIDDLLEIIEGIEKRVNPLIWVDGEEPELDQEP